MSLKLLLLTISIVNTKACVTKPVFKITKQLIAHGYYDRYDRSFVPETFMDHKTMIDSTIICSSINSLQNLSYSFEEQDYDQFLKFVNSNITIIPASGLSQFSSIKKLYLNSSNVNTIMPGAFNGLIKLEELHLNNNNLEKIVAGIFNSLQTLKFLNLNLNRIVEIQVHSFFGMSSLKWLSLSQNNLTEITLSDIIQPSSFLDHLDLSGNPLCSVNGNSIAVEEFFANKSLLVDIRLPEKLKRLNLSSNQIEELDFSNITNLIDSVDLSHNNITDLNYFEKLSSIWIDVSFNRIKNFDSLNSTVESLTLDKNYIELLESVGNDTKMLTILRLSHNKISKIDKHFFQTFPYLKILDLSLNKICDLHPKIFINQRDLLSLNLSSNEIMNIPYGVFNGLSRLNILDLSRNKLENLPTFFLTELSSLAELYLDNNRFKIIYIQQFTSRPLAKLSLDQNRWQCKFLAEIFASLKASIVKGNSFDGENYNGIACNDNAAVETPNFEKNSTGFESTNLREFVDQFFSKLNESNKIQNSALEKFFNEDFVKSKFRQYFDKDYAKSKFFEFLQNYKVDNKNSSESTNLKEFQDQFFAKLDARDKVQNSVSEKFFNEDFAKSKFRQYFEREYKVGFVDKNNSLNSEAKAIFAENKQEGAQIRTILAFILCLLIAILIVCLVFLGYYCFRNNVGKDSLRGPFSVEL